MKFPMYEKETKNKKYRDDPYRAVNFRVNEEGRLVCPNNKEFFFLRTEPVKGNQYGRTVELHQCEDCSGCPHRSKCHKSKTDRIIRLNYELTSFHKEVLENLTSIHGALLPRHLQAPHFPDSHHHFSGHPRSPVLRTGAPYATGRGRDLVLHSYRLVPGRRGGSHFLYSKFPLKILQISIMQPIVSMLCARISGNFHQGRSPLHRRRLSIFTARVLSIFHGDIIIVRPFFEECLRSGCISQPISNVLSNLRPADIQSKGKLLLNHTLHFMQDIHFTGRESCFCFSLVQTACQQKQFPCISPGQYLLEQSHSGLTIQYPRHLVVSDTENDRIDFFPGQHRTHPRLRLWILRRQVNRRAAGSNWFNHKVFLFPISKVHFSNISDPADTMSAIADIVAFPIHVPSSFHWAIEYNHIVSKIGPQLQRQFFPKENSCFLCKLSFATRHKMKYTMIVTSGISA